MTLDEIFKEKPELLDEPVVKKLIAYVQDRHKRNTEIAKRHLKFYDRVFDLVMYSDRALIDGNPCDQVVDEIMETIGKMDI